MEQEKEKSSRNEKTQISLTLAENESVIRVWCENCDDIQIRPMKLGKTGGTGDPEVSLGKSTRNLGCTGI